jgi:hypothetical protein
MDERARHVGENEVVFREVNERLRELGEGFSLVSDTAEFVCECGRADCTARVRMTLAAYEEIRSDPTRFFVIKGHEIPEYERLVEERDEYLVVEKNHDDAAEIAIENDPRD